MRLDPRSAWLVACAIVSGAARGEVLDASASGFTLENSRIVAAAPAVVWRALVDDVDRWWPKDHTWWGAESRRAIEPRAGGCFCETGGVREARHLEVVFAEPPRLLRMVGGLGPLQGMGLHGVLEFRIEPVESGSRITLYYRAGGYVPEDLRELAPIVDAVQALQLGGLADFLTAQQNR